MSYPAISSNTLFHFVNKREYLIDILENNFRARYCLEKLDCIFPEETRENYWSIAIPMTCFCDLPLSNTYKHLEEYGGYGIGLTKDWGKEKGLSPILYVHDNSSLKKAVRASVSALVYNIIEGSEITKKMVEELNDVIYFTKPYEGDFHRNGKVIPNVRFYDEREWRFVPDDALRLSEENFKDPKILDAHYKILGDSRTLYFTPDDVQYIVVEKESEILPMYEEIKRIKSPKFSPDEIKKLQTKIICAERIKEDF